MPLRCSWSLRARAGAPVAIILSGGTVGAQPTFQGLGTLAGGQSSVARAVSANGSVVVGRAFTAAYTGFIWTAASGMQPIPGLPGSINTDLSGLSADGSVAVGTSFIPPLHFRAFRWTAPGGAQALGTLTGDGSSAAYAISADGSTVTGWSNNPDPAHNTAYRWLAAGGMAALPLAPGAGASEGAALSADGSIIAGTVYLGSGIRHAARWAGAGVEDLGVPSGRDETVALALSADGSVALIVADNTSISGPTDYLSFRWTAAGGLMPLALLPGASGCDARAMSADGGTIVGVCTFPSAPSRPFIWTMAAGTRDLVEVLGPAAPGGWTGISPEAISADASTIVGEGRNAAGAIEAFLIRFGTACYANCDHSTQPPVLNVNDFLCFQTQFAAGSSTANCDHSTQPPVLNVNDYLCFQTAFAAGCP